MNAPLVSGRAKATAYHEAGHVVIATYLSMPVHTATIVPDKKGRTHGHVQHDLPLRRTSKEEVYELTLKARDRMERQIVVSLAGAAAQRRYSRRSYRRGHSGSDDETAVGLALRIAGVEDGATLLLKYLGWRAEQMVRNHWRDVERVALALLEKQTLNASDIRALMQPQGGRSDSV